MVNKNTTGKSTCALCLQERELCKSHIIPEFFYKILYDEKGRIRLRSIDLNETIQYRQQGVYERLLCAKCESKLSGYEKYAKSLFYDSLSFHDTVEDNQIKVVNINYAKFKLFQLSIIWRAGIAKSRFFKNIELGPHQEKLCEMLLYEKPGHFHEYGCIIAALLWDENITFDIFISPQKSRLRDGRTVYRLIFGSCLWIFVITSNNETFDRRHHFLQEDGTMLLNSVRGRCPSSARSHLPVGRNLYGFDIIISEWK